MELWILYPMAISLILTMVLELGLAFLYGIRGKNDYLLLILVNVITNPPVVLAYYLLTYHTSIKPIVIIPVLELMAILTEGLYYRKYGNTYRRTMIFSLIANLFSYSMGILINRMMEWIW